MVKEGMPFGRYLVGNSWLHQRNAASKILAIFLYMIALFVADNWLMWGLLALVCFGMLALGQIPLKSLWHGTKLILILAVITFVLNLFLYPGEVLWSWGWLEITREGVFYGSAYALRLLLLIMSAAILTLTTSPIRLTDGLEDLMQPLKKIKVPVHEIAMMMSIALRFLPTLQEEFQRIQLAQRARGADFGGKGNVFKKMNRMIPLLIPLFVSSLRWAEELAQAMEARCYRGGEGRTRWKQAAWQRQDTLLLAGSILLFLAVLLERLV